MKISALCLLFAGLALTGCGTLTVTDVTPEDAETLHAAHDVDLDTEAAKLVAPLVESGYTPGVVAGIYLPDGSMHFYAYGVADQETNEPMTADTLTAAGSLSKGFLAAMLTQFVDEGKLHWDDTLPKLFPGVKMSPAAQKITLLQLATHTSGLPRQPITLQTLSYFVEYLFDGENFYPHINRDYTLDYLATFEPDAPPGTIQYSNIGYGLLGTILEQRSGKSIDALLAERITGPLKLKCTGYTPELLPCNAHRARGYSGDSPRFILRGNPTPDWDFTHFLRGAAAIHSTARELLTFAAAHLKDRTRMNKLLSGNLKQRFADPDGGIGIGWTIDQVDGQPIDYEIGLVAGYTSYLGVDPAHKTAVVLLQNAFNWDSSVGHKLLVYLKNSPYVTAPGDSAKTK